MVLEVFLEQSGACLGVSVYSFASGNSVETRLGQVQTADDCSRSCGVDRLTTVF